MTNPEKDTGKPCEKDLAELFPGFFHLIDSTMQESQFREPINWALELLKKTKEPKVIFELGVGNGGSIKYIAERAERNWSIYGFDWWNGNPEPWRPGFGTNHFAIGDPPAVPSNVKLVTGLFQDSLPKFLKENPNITHIDLLHVDCDLYSSTKSAFDTLGPLIGNGTLIVFDEFVNYPGWEEHEYKAFQEFLVANSYRIKVSWARMVKGMQQLLVRISATNETDTGDLPDTAGAGVPVAPVPASATAPSTTTGSGTPDNVGNTPVPATVAKDAELPQNPHVAPAVFSDLLIDLL